MGEHIFELNFPVFGYTVEICVTENIKESRISRNYWLGPPTVDLEGVEGLHSYAESSKSIIFITPKSSVGCIAHEYFHALWRMFEYVGAQHDNETFAYHLSYGLNEILKCTNTSQST